MYYSLSRLPPEELNAVRFACYQKGNDYFGSSLATDFNRVRNTPRYKSFLAFYSSVLQLSDGPLAVPRFLARGEQASPPGRGNAGSAGDGPVRDVGPAESAGESAGAASGVHFRRVPRETWGWEGGGT